jgi:cephalosporin-C deacetylase-like acetyl esterase
MPRKSFQLFLSILLLAAQSAAAGLSAEVSTDKPEAVYRAGDKVTFGILLKEDGKVLAGKELKYQIIQNGLTQITEGMIVSAAEPVTVQSTLAEPGFLKCEVNYASKAGPTTRGAVGAGFDPEQIKPSLPVPDDFDAFWAAQKKLLADDPPKPVLTPVKSSDAEIETFDVQINCPGGAPVSGYLARPKNAKPKSLPAILYSQSAGVHDSDLPHAIRGAKLNALAMDFNAHGLPNGKGEQFYKDQYPNGPFKGYSSRGMEDRETMYFRGMYLRVMRALDFLTTLPEWDGKVLIVEGSSQGGGQSLVAAGTDHRVTLCIASVPAMCDHTGILVNREPGWPKMLKLPGRTEQATQVVRYFDAMNFASRIECETYVTVGFADQTCPPASVYAAYNNIHAKKHIVPRPAMGHSFPADQIARFNDVIREHVAAKSRD